MIAWHVLPWYLRRAIPMRLPSLPEVRRTRSSTFANHSLDKPSELSPAKIALLLHALTSNMSCPRGVCISAKCSFTGYRSSLRVRYVLLLYGPSQTVLQALRRAACIVVEVTGPSFQMHVPATSVSRITWGRKSRSPCCIFVNSVASASRGSVPGEE